MDANISVKNLATKTSDLFPFLLNFCAVFFFLVSCSSLTDSFLENEYLPSTSYVPAWTSVHQGTSLAVATLKDPPFAVYCLRVDLENPFVSAEIVSSPDGTTLSRTSSIVTKQSLVAAVNATPFSPVHIFEGKKARIGGLSVSKGTFISPPFKRYAALCLESGSRARVLSPSEALMWEPGPLDHGCGGFFLLLKDSHITYKEFEHVFDSGRAPRTAAGTSENGRYLYLMVIDGNNRCHSIGATFSETAHWIASFGATDALMLDGGGSSTLALRNEAGKVNLVNIPVQGIIPRIERPVANNIGIRITQP